MEWFNPFGLVFIAIIMIPNIVFAIRCKDGFTNNYRNKTVELVEQIGRFGCFGFMIFNVPGTWFGWASNESFALYLTWMLCWLRYTASSGSSVGRKTAYSKPWRCPSFRQLSFCSAAL